MLNTAELRNGNLLNHSLKLMHPETTLPDELVEVQAVYEDRIAYGYPNIENRVEPFEDDKAEQAENTIPFTELQPVPLTEDWLLKAGIEIDGNKASIQQLTFQWNGKALISEDESVFQYVHQLQNYFETGTGQPLNIQFK